LTNIKDMSGQCGEHPSMASRLSLSFRPSHGSTTRQGRRLWMPLLGLALLVASGAQAQAPDAARQRELVRMVRQDCGSCHGLYLTGGLGPALTREALADKPLDSLASTIYGGRPGTPMAPWKAMLSEADALWIAEQLLAGFPEPSKAPR
jgi:cytochrome c55X